MSKKRKRSPSREDQKQNQEPSKKSRRVLPGAVGLVLLALASFVAWIIVFSGNDLGPLPEGYRASDLNLILVTLDSTRADRIGAYGYPDVETPNLDRIAEEGVLFEQAVSATPLTLPAHATLFTGKFPPSHGVRDNGLFHLDESELTLAEHLKNNGFETGGFIGAFVLDSRWGIGQGFDTYFDDFDVSKSLSPSPGSVERPGSEVVDRALGWLDDVSSSRFFAWVHFNDPHAPYTPPGPFDTRYRNQPYVGEIAYTDSQIGRILDWLKGGNLTEKTIIVVVGDHGESLDEHGETRHGFFVYESSLRVPFLIRAPYERTRERRVGDVVRSVDVVPTILDLLDLPSMSGADGKSLVSLMTGDVDTLKLAGYSESPYPMFHFGWSDLRSIRFGDLKYIDAPRPELYDIAADPNETRNLYEEQPSVAEDLRSRLFELEDGFGAPASGPVPAIDPDMRDLLAGLGYIATYDSSPGSPNDRSLLVDPKDKIEIFNLMVRAREISLVEPGSEEAVNLLQTVINEDPQIIDAWFMLGNEYSRRREYERSIETYARALELKPDFDLAVINLASAYRRLGKDEMAVGAYRRFMELEPANPQIRYEAAQILIENGELDAASGLLREAIRLEPRMAAARNALGVVLIGKGDVEGAEREILAALEQNPNVRHANYNLALIADHRKDFQTAIESYEKEIGLYPNSYKSLYNLGTLQGYLGNGRAQIESYQRAILVNPDFGEGHLALAKLYLDQDRNLDDAMELARKGLDALGPNSSYTPLGHYILADIYNRQEKPGLAEQELAKGKAVEARQQQN